MKTFAMVNGLTRYLSSLHRDQRGVSAVEFAMLLPLMVTLYLGAVEISQGVGINRKVTLTARTVADLASQVSSIHTTDMSNMLSAASSVVAPFPVNQLKATVSAVSIAANSVPKVTWSCTLNGTKRSVGSTVTMPTALKIANTQLIWSEVSYNYVPTIG